MKTLYIECNMGAAGDMLAAALLELVDDKESFVTAINSIGIESVHVIAEPSTKCGIIGTHVSVIVDGGEEASEDVDAARHEHHHDHHKHDHHNKHDHHEHHDHDHHDHDHHDHDHHHTSLIDIDTHLSRLSISPKIRRDVMAVYQIIAEAEAAAHGRHVEQVHFHEVGNLDALTDIAAVCMLMDLISPKRVVVSPVHVGSGFVRCAHGILPVPAPATAHILRGIPAYSGMIKGELCTPTGAALLKYFAHDFGPMPTMRVARVGYGMGKKDFEAANCVRAFIGEADGRLSTGGPNGQAAELQCNIDDMTGESIGYACQILLTAGARDVSATPIYMKKNRPATMLTVLCDVDRADEFAAMILKYTATFGVRKTIVERYTLQSAAVTRGTPYGEIRLKTGTNFGINKTKLEYDDVAALAQQHSLSIIDMERILWSYINKEAVL